MVEKRTVLIVSEDAEFPRQISARWQSERNVPAFMLLGSGLRHGLDAMTFDLAIIGPGSGDALRPALQALEPGGNPVIVVTDEAQTIQGIRREFPRAVAVHRHGGWTDTVVLLGIEVLRRVEAVNRAERAEQASALMKCHATLGQYVIEMRHTLNNALTSVLGNAELLLLEPGAFSAGVLSQIDTIRNMALRMHEVLQRFSSLEKELMFAEQQLVKEQRAQAAAVGQ
jgi:signal transduction histidine kinase